MAGWDELPNATHPLWGLVRLVIMMASLTAILYFTASKFDASEIKQILLMFLAAAGMEGAGAFLGRQRSPEE